MPDFADVEDTAAFLRDQAEAEKNAHSERLSALANQRIRLFIIEFKRRFPKRRLKLTFGMGTELIEIDDWHVDTAFGHGEVYIYKGRYRTNQRRAKCLNFIHDLIDDLGSITDDYRTAAPDADWAVTPEAA